MTQDVEKIAPSLDNEPAKIVQIAYSVSIKILFQYSLYYYLPCFILLNSTGANSSNYL